MSVRKKLFSVFFIFDMPRIPQDVRERAIGMLKAGAIEYWILSSCYSTLEATFSRNRAYERSTTYWTSARHDAWPRPLYSEYQPVQSLPNCHS